MMFCHFISACIVSQSVFRSLSRIPGLRFDMVGLVLASAHHILLLLLLLPPLVLVVVCVTHIFVECAKCIFDCK